MIQFKFSTCILLLFIFLTACKVSKDNLPSPSNVTPAEYLLSWEEDNSISKDQLSTYWGNNDTANAFINYEVNVFRISYQSVDLVGNKKVLSGAVLVPDKSGDKSTIAIQHATFFADVEAPSVNEGFSVVSRKSIFAAHGYVVFLPDYYGYGEDKAAIHPYHHAESLEIASRDMVFAGYEFLQQQEIEHNQKLFIAGYSEGAYATAALQQGLENKTDLPFTLIASSLGSGAYNLKATFEQFTADINQLFGCTPCNAFLLQSYNEVYDIKHPLDYYFQQPYADKIEKGLFLGDFDAGAIARELSVSPAQLFNPSFLINYYQNKESTWMSALETNSIHDWQPKHPTLLTHNQNDNVSPFFNSLELAELNQANEQLIFMPINNTDHFSGIFQWGILSMDYFDRF